MPLIKASLQDQSFEEYYNGIGYPAMIQLIEKLDGFFYISIIYGLTSATGLMIVLEDDFLRLSYDGKAFRFYDFENMSTDASERIILSFDDFESGFKILIQKLSNRNVWKELPEFQ